MSGNLAVTSDLRLAVAPDDTVCFQVPRLDPGESIHRLFPPCSFSQPRLLLVLLLRPLLRLWHAFLAIVHITNPLKLLPSSYCPQVEVPTNASRQKTGRKLRPQDADSLDIELDKLAKRGEIELYNQFFEDIPPDKQVSRARGNI